MTLWRMILVALIGAAVGGVLVWSVDRTGQARIEATVHDYLLANPEIIPQAMQKLQEREAGKAVAAMGPAVTAPFGSAYAGDPRGDVSVVEYYDYNCGYCRASLPIVDRLVAADPKVRIVYRDLPILADTSRTAARMSLAAAAQGKFGAFHAALYAKNPVDDAAILAAAHTAGVDLAAAQAFVPQADAEIRRNLDTASKLGMQGTPSWIVGDRVLVGAQSLEALQDAVKAARE